MKRRGFFETFHHHHHHLCMQTLLQNSNLPHFDLMGGIWPSGELCHVLVNLPTPTLDLSSFKNLSLFHSHSLSEGLPWPMKWKKMKENLSGRRQPCFAKLSLTYLLTHFPHPLQVQIGHWIFSYFGKIHFTFYHLITKQILLLACP